ncbi:hypothetical protein CBR_g33996 [Chara braunii]|uniref:Uncharacterized protein n=1 Tax=Chara braunii TaxID=69332 RepID=A0A388LHU0_CHABU|nr:hypothetical protein CBR_g33996 [Chara braunii]|eukprot:GBG81815.1 hypothetical protein CBR_g33996 [Chara braunii]
MVKYFVELRAPDCEGVNHDEEFLLIGGVIHLRGKKLLACEGDGLLAGWNLGVSGRVLDGGDLDGVAGEMLGQHDSNGEVGGINGDIEMTSGVGDLEDRGRGDGLLEEVESVLAAIVPIQGLVLVCEFVERVRDLEKVVNERAVIVGKAEKGTTLEEGLGWGVLDEGCDLRGVHRDAFSRDNVAKDREDLVNVLKVRLEGGAKDEDVIKVNGDTDFEEVTEDAVHAGLECGGGIGESERHYKELVVPEPRAKCGIVGVLLTNTDLVEATAEVDFGEIFGSTEAIKKFRYPGEWVLVLDRDPVQGSVVCAHADSRWISATESSRKELMLRLEAPSAIEEDEGEVAEEDGTVEVVAADAIAAAAAAAAAAHREVLVWRGGIWRKGGQFLFTRVERHQVI